MDEIIANGEVKKSEGLTKKTKKYEKIFFSWDFAVLVDRIKNIPWKETFLEISLNL